MIDVGYAGVAGASRLMDGVCPYGHMPDKQRRGLRRAATQRRPDRPTSRRTGAASRRSRAVTRTGRRCTSPTCPAVAVMGWSGNWDPCRRRTWPRRRSTSWRSSGSSSPAGGWRARRHRRAARVRVGGQPVHALRAQHEHERRARRGAAGLDARCPLGSRCCAARCWPRRRSRSSPRSRSFPLFASLRHRRRHVHRVRGGGDPACSRCSRSTPTACRSSGTARSTTSSAAMTPMAIWTLGQLPPGLARPAGGSQHVAPVRRRVGIVALAVFPRAAEGRRRGGRARRPRPSSALQIAASYWFYPYICWWLPVVMAALLLPRRAEPDPVPAPSPRPSRSRPVGLATQRAGTPRSTVARPSPSHSISDALDPHVAVGGLEPDRQLRREAAQDRGRCERRSRSRAGPSCPRR